MKKIFHTDVDLYFLKPCIKCIEKVTRNKVIIRAKKVNLCLSILSWKFRHLYLTFGNTLSLIIGIIKEKNKIG